MTNGFIDKKTTAGGGPAVVVTQNQKKEANQPARRPQSPMTLGSKVTNWAPAACLLILQNILTISFQKFNFCGKVELLYQVSTD
jgi:hypothetical protein